MAKRKSKSEREKDVQRKAAQRAKFLAIRERAALRAYTFAPKGSPEKATALEKLASFAPPALATSKRSVASGKPASVRLPERTPAVPIRKKSLDVSLRYPKRDSMSPIFRKFTRKVGTARGRTFAMLQVTIYYHTKPSRTIKSFPLPLGYMNAAGVKRLTLSDLQESLALSKGSDYVIDEVHGFVQVKPTRERRGILFEKAAGSNARKGHRGVRKGGV